MYLTVSSKSSRISKFFNSPISIRHYPSSGTFNSFNCNPPYSIVIICDYRQILFQTKNFFLSKIQFEFKSQRQKMNLLSARSFAKNKRYTKILLCIYISKHGMDFSYFRFLLRTHNSTQNSKWLNILNDCNEMNFLCH